MGRTIVKTFEEIRKEWTPEKLKEWSKNLPSYPDDDPDPITDEDIASGRVRFLGRGFAVIEEILKGNVPPKSEVKTAPVALRIPEPVN